MPRVLFAKFNINEKIYDVYDNKESLEELLNKIYHSLKIDMELSENNKGIITNYKFITLDKNPDTMIINGRLVAYAPGVHVSYDEELDDVVERYDNKKATFVPFSFDVNRETIGFVAKNDFGRMQFIDRFTNLVEEMCPEVGEIQLVLEQDKQELTEKLSRFAHVQEITLSLYPPNNDRDDFERMFGIKPEKLSETGGTKFLLSIKGTAKKGIDLASTYIKNLILGISLGYGVLTAEGKNRSNEYFKVKSDSHALYAVPIKEDDKDSIPSIQEKTRAGITSLSYVKAVTRNELEGNSKLEVRYIDDESNTGDLPKRTK